MTHNNVKLIADRSTETQDVESLVSQNYVSHMVLRANIANSVTACLLFFPPQVTSSQLYKIHHNFVNIKEKKNYLEPELKFPRL